MAPDVKTTKDFIRASKGMVFTFEEAIEFMKVLDTLPGSTLENIRWVRVGTNIPVSIGYTDIPPKSNIKKTSPIPSNFYQKYKK